jgi:hypothetical protein
MQLSEYNKRADEYTAKASEIVRQLILGGLAIIWVFKTTVNGKDTLSMFLSFPLIGLSLSLLADLLQYVVAGKIWKSFFLKKEKEILDQYHKGNTTSLDPDIKAPKYLRRPVYFFYWIKILLLIGSYVLLIIYLLRQVAVV